MVALCCCEGQARGLICAAVARGYLGVSVLGSHAHVGNESDAGESWTYPSLIARDFGPGASSKSLDGLKNNLQILIRAFLLHGHSDRCRCSHGLKYTFLAINLVVARHNQRFAITCFNNTIALSKLWQINTRDMNLLPRMVRL